MAAALPGEHWRPRGHRLFNYGFILLLAPRRADVRKRRGEGCAAADGVAPSAQDKETGGFGGSEGHDAHLLYTLSAVQILALYDKLSLLDADRVAAFVAGLQQPDGSFAGDKWGEVDTRFSYCALSCCSLLGRCAGRRRLAAESSLRAAWRRVLSFGCSHVSRDLGRL